MEKICCTLSGSLIFLDHLRNLFVEPQVFEFVTSFVVFMARFRQIELKMSWQPRQEREIFILGMFCLSVVSWRTSHSSRRKDKSAAWHRKLHIWTLLWSVTRTQIYYKRTHNQICTVHVPLTPQETAVCCWVANLRKKMDTVPTTLCVGVILLWLVCRSGGQVASRRFMRCSGQVSETHTRVDAFPRSSTVHDVKEKSLCHNYFCLGDASALVLRRVFWFTKTVRQVYIVIMEGNIWFQRWRPACKFWRIGSSLLRVERFTLLSTRSLCKRRQSSSFAKREEVLVAQCEFRICEKKTLFSGMN